MNDQRKVIYEQRRELMEADDVSETIADMRNEQLRFCWRATSNMVLLPKSGRLKNLNRIWLGCPALFCR